MKNQKQNIVEKIMRGVRERTEKRWPNVFTEHPNPIPFRREEIIPEKAEVAEW